MVLAGIRKGDDGPIEFNAPIAYPKHQKGAAPGKQVGDPGTPSISVTACSLCFLAPPLVPSAERQAGQAPILLETHNDAGQYWPASLFPAISIRLAPPLTPASDRQQHYCADHGHSKTS
jgi:hypothetical protein